MRINVWDRFLSALAGLIVLFLGVCGFVFGLGIFPFKIDLSILNGPFLFWQRAVIVAGAVVLCLLGIHSLLLLFRRQKEKGFIVQHTEHGDVSISMHAMENLVRKCIDTHEELKVSHTRIHRTKDGVVVDIKVSLASGVNIPLTVNALQKQIKHYITSCSGVDVKEVRVMVETGNHQSPKGAEVIAPDLEAADASVTAADIIAAAVPPADEEKEAAHQRIFKHEEMPNDVPTPPENDGKAVPVESDGVNASVDAVADKEVSPEDEKSIENANDNDKENE